MDQVKGEPAILCCDNQMTGSLSLECRGVTVSECWVVFPWLWELRKGVSGTVSVLPYPVYPSSQEAEAGECP